MIIAMDRLVTCFTQGYTSLNRIQSIVYPMAYGSSENMLICGQSIPLSSNSYSHTSLAPTGAVRIFETLLSLYLHHGI
jgi:hypothetical protein